MGHVPNVILHISSVRALKYVVVFHLNIESTNRHFVRPNEKFTNNRFFDHFPGAAGKNRFYSVAGGGNALKWRHVYWIDNGDEEHKSVIEHGNIRSETATGKLSFPSCVCVCRRTKVAIGRIALYSLYTYKRDRLQALEHEKLIGSINRNRCDFVLLPSAG